MRVTEEKYKIKTMEYRKQKQVICFEATKLSNDYHYLAIDGENKQQFLDYVKSSNLFKQDNKTQKATRLLNNNQMRQIWNDLVRIGATRFNR